MRLSSRLRSWERSLFMGLPGAFLSRYGCRLDTTVFRAQGAFSLKQSDYGIKPVSVAGGTIKVKDELRFTLDIVAHS